MCLVRREEEENSGQQSGLLWFLGAMRKFLISSVKDKLILLLVIITQLTGV
jgi:hypothetical protein